jgi:protein-S-isoprenylcysteine O-methyltransferase Ste14
MKGALLWLRGLIFTVLVPFVVGGYVPWSLRDTPAAPGLWSAGWLLVVVGGGIYFACLLRFLSAGGTPAVFFTRPLRFLIGEEPRRVVEAGLYRFSRNPMYVGVVLTIFGQALVFASARIATYGVCVWLAFHVVVVLLEEPHLRATRGAGYEAYCRRTPRWLGWVR